MNATGASRFRLGACFFEWRLHPPGRALRARPTVAASRGVCARRTRLARRLKERASPRGSAVASRVCLRARVRVPDVLRVFTGFRIRWVSERCVSLWRGASRHRASVVCARRRVRPFPVRCASSRGVSFLIRHRMKQGYPLNLSISLSGGEETNQDAPSNGE